MTSRPTNSRGRRSRPRKRGFRPPPEHVLEARRAAVPEVTYPEDLPVSARRDDIAEAIRNNQVVIVSGETGSGKTTQLPKICLELGYGVTGTIGHTQPRRLAARTVSARIAEELGTTPGQAVGFQIRFTDNVSSSTLIKLMTDGILLAEIQRDPLLRRYEVIIVDEAHERSLNIDFLLGYLRQLLPKRPDLKLIITSATIDSEKFATHFGTADSPAPVIEVTGRTYPVEIRYRPQVDEDADQATSICRAVDELMAAGPGDVLVFCSGEREIRDAAEALEEHLGPRYLRPGEVRSSAHAANAVEVLPLYARLSNAEQQRVFQPHTTRRVVLATNVAETSLTVPGIRYVVDPGTARISRYSNRTKVQRLPIEPISQASANQRSGRSGRVAPGIAIRLYEEEDFNSRPEFTEPEILRTSLASVILQMTAIGLGDIAKFPFVDPPDTRAIRDGVNLLHELGAMAPTGKGLTKVGRQLAGLPIDPRLGRMLIEAGRLGCVREVMIIVAGLSIQDVRERPAEHQQAADEQHARFADPHSDFLAMLNLWEYVQEKQRELSGSAFRRTVRREFLHYLRIREWQDVYAQLKQMAKPLGITLKRTGGAADPDRIHQALLAGLLSHIGVWSDRTRDYLGARGARFVIFPGSHLAKKHPEWIMAGELVETSRLFARQVARIRPEWIEPLAGHLTRRSFSDPYWSTRNAAAMAREKVMLLGVPIVSDRPVPLSQVDAELAREMFIRHALVERQWPAHHKFLERNDDVWAEAQELTSRARRPDLLIDPEELVEFYLRHIPPQVTSAAHFNTWWKKVEDPRVLDFTLDLLVPARHTIDTDSYPEQWVQRDLTLPLTYHYSPGHEGDGVMVHIPIALLPQVLSTGFDWLVPGLLDELVLATIRALPKRVRVQLVPAPDSAREIRAALPEWAPTTAAADLSFAQAFSDAARQVKGAEVPLDAIDTSRLPEHLQMTFRVEDERGVIITEGHDLERLQRDLRRESGDAVRTAVRSALSTAQKEQLEQMLTPAPAAAPADHKENAPPARIEASDLEAFPPEGIPEVLTTHTSGADVRGYPALVRSGRKVSLQILADPVHQAREHEEGVAALLANSLTLSTTRITSRWNTSQTLSMAGAPDTTEDLVADLHLAAVKSVRARTGGAERKELGLVSFAKLRTAEQFTAWQGFLRDRLEDEIFAISQQVAAALSALRETKNLISASTSMALLGTLTDVKQQVSELIDKGFVARTPPQRLAHLARYLQAASIRIEKAAENPRSDEAHAWVVQELTSEWEAAVAADDGSDPQRSARLADVRWQLEELRVSLFAQQLGTAAPVSDKRIRRALA